MNQEQIKALSIQEGVNFMNNTFGNTPLKTRDDAYWAKMGKQAAITKEEVEEMIHGIQTDDRVETRDGVCDTLVTAYGLVHIGDVALAEDVVELGKGDIPINGLINEVKTSMDIVFRAINNKNENQLAFATKCLLMETNVMSKEMGIDIEADMYAVLVSNLSKVSKTQGDALVTQQYYRESVGIETRLEDCPTMPGYIIKVQGNQTGKDGKNYPDGKFLKCRVSFHGPKFN